MHKSYECSLFAHAKHNNNNDFRDFFSFQLSEEQRNVIKHIVNIQISEFCINLLLFTWSTRVLAPQIVFHFMNFRFSVFFFHFPISCVNYSACLLQHTQTIDSLTFAAITISRQNERKTKRCILGDSHFKTPTSTHSLRFLRYLLLLFVVQNLNLCK